MKIITDKIKLLSTQNNQQVIETLNECLQLFRVNLNVIYEIEQLPYDDSFTNITEHIYKMFVPVFMPIIIKYKLPMWSEDYAKLEWYRVLYFVYYCLHKINLEGKSICFINFYTINGELYPIPLPICHKSVYKNLLIIFN